MNQYWKFIFLITLQNMHTKNTSLESQQKKRFGLDNEERSAYYWKELQTGEFKESTFRWHGKHVRDSKQLLAHLYVYSRESKYYPKH